MQVLQSKENLPSNYLYKTNRYTFLLVPLNKGEQILAQRFEDDADVNFFGATMIERVEKRYNVRSAWMKRVGFGDFREKLDFVAGCLGIAAS